MVVSKELLSSFSIPSLYSVSLFKNAFKYGRVKRKLSACLEQAYAADNFFFLKDKGKIMKKYIGYNFMDNLNRLKFTSTKFRVIINRGLL